MARGRSPGILPAFREEGKDLDILSRIVEIESGQKATSIQRGMASCGGGVEITMIAKPKIAKYALPRGGSDRLRTTFTNHISSLPSFTGKENSKLKDVMECIQVCLLPHSIRSICDTAARDAITPFQIRCPAVCPLQP